MAWYALYKWFAPWRRTKYINRTNEYSRYLYDTWFESLTEEEQQRVLQRIEERKLKRRREAEAMFCRIGTIMGYLQSKTHNDFYSSMFR